MFGLDFVPGFIMGIREGLEAFLIIAIMMKYVQKINRPDLRKHVGLGLLSGIIGSVIFGLALFGISDWIGTNSDNIAKLWEFIASFAALVLISTFIVFMIRHSESISQEITEKMDLNLTGKGILLLAFVMVIREGAEISLFAFAAGNEANYVSGALFGIVASSVIAYLIFKSLIKVPLKLLFRITLVYLILQAGFMFGYSIHELLSYLKAEQILSESSFLLVKLFDASGTFLDHKSAPVGMTLYVLFGWYSKPEIIQFLIQYVYTVSFMVYFYRQNFKK